MTTSMRRTGQAITERIGLYVSNSKGPGVRVQIEIGSKNGPATGPGTPARYCTLLKNAGSKGSYRAMREALDQETSHLPLVSATASARGT